MSDQVENSAVIMPGGPPSAGALRICAALDLDGRSESASAVIMSLSLARHGSECLSSLASLGVGERPFSFPERGRNLNVLRRRLRRW